MPRIYKYKLEIEDVQVLSIPKPATILSVIEQNHSPVLYAIVDPGSDLVRVMIYLQGTGESMEYVSHIQARFLGTVNTRVGLIWHVFYKVVL